MQQWVNGLFLFSLWGCRNTRTGRQLLLLKERWDSRCVINLGDMLLLPDVEAEVSQAHCCAGEAVPITLYWRFTGGQQGSASEQEAALIGPAVRAGVVTPCEVKGPPTTGSINS